MNKIIEWLLTPWRALQDHLEYKRKLKELKEKDPFIYK